MGLKIQRRMVTKARVITTLIAVFALIAQPGYSFMAGQVANAIEISGDVAKIYNAADLAAAASNPAIKNFSIKASFSTSDKTVLDRNVNIDGNNNVITFLGVAGWHGEYVFQAYKIAASFKDITITGGDAAIYANGATVNLQGTVNVSGNEFGGIEVSQGSGVTTNAVLNTAGATVVNVGEVNTKPTAWTDHASTANAVVNGSFTMTTHIGLDQKQYYIDATHAGIVATNDTAHKTYDNLQAAIDSAANGDTISLQQNVTANSQVTITKALTINGSSHTITAASTLTNAVIEEKNINAITINNLTIDGAGNYVHGVKAFKGNVSLNDVTIKNTTKHAIQVNSSTVTVNNFVTDNNTWGVAEVYQNTSSGLPALLTINGTSKHTHSNGMITVNDTTKLASVVDSTNQYVYQDYGVARVYTLKPIDTQAPTVPTNGAPHNKNISTNVFDFTWDASTDATPGVVKYEFRSSTDQTQVGSAPDTSSAWKSDVLSEPKIHSTGAGDGTWYWQVRSIDAAGNKSAWSSTWNVTLDTKKPTAPTINTPINDQFFASSPIAAKWSVSTDLNGSGVKEYQVKYVYDDHHLVSGSDTIIRTTADTKRNHMPELNEQGGVTVWVQAVDNAGNESGWSSPVHYTYDATAPNVVVTAPAANQRLSGTALSVSGTATDTNFNYYYCYLTTNATISYKGNTYTPGQEVGVRDARCNTTWTSVTTDGHLGGIDLAGLPDGSYTINVVGYDKAKNNNAANPTRVSFILDNSAPLVSINKPADTTASVPITLTGHVDDAQASLSLWNGTKKIDDITDIDTNGDWKYLLTDGLEQGTTTLRVVATDTLGNESTISTSPDSETTFTVGRFLSSQSGGAGVDTPASVVLSPPRTLLASNPTSTLVDPPVVLGTQTAKDNVLGTSDKVAAIAPSAQGWKIYGVAWYWWVLIIAAVAAIMWWIVAAARRRSENA